MSKAKELARYIMSIGDKPNNPVQRMQFMGGKWGDKETPQGGINEIALAEAIQRWFDAD